MEEHSDATPGLGVPLAHVLIYWIPISLLLWGLILAALYLLTGGWSAT
jgi:hypothetical protein